MEIQWNGIQFHVPSIFCRKNTVALNIRWANCQVPLITIFAKVCLPFPLWYCMLFFPVLLPYKWQWLYLICLHILSAQDSHWLQKELHKGGLPCCREALDQRTQRVLIVPYFFFYMILLAFPKVSALIKKRRCQLMTPMTERAFASLCFYIAITSHFGSVELFFKIN